MPLTRNCDLCRIQGKGDKPATWDAKTVKGPWAYLCEDHMTTDGHPGYKSIATPLAKVQG